MLGSLELHVTPEFSVTNRKRPHRPLLLRGQGLLGVVRPMQYAMSLLSRLIVRSSCPTFRGQ